MFYDIDVLKYKQSPVSILLGTRVIGINAKGLGINAGVI